MIASFHEEDSSITTIKLCRTLLAPSDVALLAIGFRNSYRITMLDLGSNPSLGDAGAIFLASAFQQNNSIIIVRLASCGIGDAGAIALASALQHNSCITELDLSLNRIGGSGAMAISEALQHNSSMILLTVSQTLDDVVFESCSESVMSLSAPESLSAASTSVLRDGKQLTVSDYKSALRRMTDLCEVRVRAAF